MTLTQGGPEPALTVTDSAQNGSFSNTTSAPTVYITTTVFADQTSSELQAYNGNTLSNTASGYGIPAGCAVPETGATIPTAGLESTGHAAGMTISSSTSAPDEIESATGLANTGDAAGMTTLTSTATVASATSTVTLTGTALVIPMQENNTQPIEIPDPTIPSYGAATDTMAYPVDSPTDEPIVSIQPLATAPASYNQSAVTAYDSIHVPHGHPPLVTSGQDQRNWNTSTSTSCTEPNAQGLPGTKPTSSSFITSTTSRVFTGYPPSLSGYSNGTTASTSAGLQAYSTPTDLISASAVTHIEVPPPPTVPLNPCSPGIWGRPGCLSTPTSFIDAATALVGRQEQDPTVSAITLAEVPPAPTVPLNPCAPGIWGRPGCLSTPTSFMDAASTLVGRQEQDPTVSAATLTEIPPAPTVPLDSCSPGIWGRPGCLLTPADLSDAPSSPVRHQAQNDPGESPSSVVSAQPGQAQCTSTFYILPMSACTSTVYASKVTAIVNCFGCVGHHALPSVASDGGSVSHPHHELSMYTGRILT
jgi:hypothetical protein